MFNLIVSSYFITSNCLWNYTIIYLVTRNAFGFLSIKIYYALPTISFYLNIMRFSKLTKIKPILYILYNLVVHNFHISYNFISHSLRIVKQIVETCYFIAFDFNTSLKLMLSLCILMLFTYFISLSTEYNKKIINTILQ